MNDDATPTTEVNEDMALKSAEEALAAFMAQPRTPHVHQGKCPVHEINLVGGGSRGALAGFRIFDELREQGDIHWIAEGVGYHILTRHEAILQLAQNPSLFSSRYFDPRLGGEPPFILKPVNLDAPEHPKWRRLLAPVFAPGAIARWDERIVQRARELIDGFYANGQCDFVRDFALRFPTAIFLSLMGLPQSELDTFLTWETAILHPGADGTYEGLTPLQAQAAVTAYFTELLRERRKHPADEPESDLVSMALGWEIDGKPLSDEDLLSLYLLMFEAGLDTVTAELGYGMLHLATHPRDRARIVAEPSIIPNAVEELLRMYPIVNPPRVATEDTTIGGCPVKKGEYVAMYLSAAGRDERVYPNADTVDFDRERIPHLTFGAGPHRCLGSHLARHELAAAYAEWHRRIPEYELAEGVRFDESVSALLGLNSLPLTWIPSGH
jgi:cytochrome P450